MASTKKAENKRASCQLINNAEKIASKKRNILRYKTIFLEIFWLGIGLRGLFNLSMSISKTILYELNAIIHILYKIMLKEKVEVIISPEDKKKIKKEVMKAEHI